MSLRQTSFAAGELDPLMWGRTDLSLFRHGLRRLRDFFVNPAGNAMTRPGTRYCGQAYANLPSRLVPFIVSDEDAYVLEFSSGGSIQPWRNGAKVGSPLTMPWSFTPLDELQFVQSGDVLTICARFAVYELRRTSVSTFTIAAMSFGKAAPQFVALPATTKTTVPGIINTGNLTVGTATSPVRKWRWWVSTVMRDSNGRTFESAAHEVTETLSPGIGAYGGSAALGPDRPVTITRRTSGVGTLWTGSVVYETKGYNWYRGVGDYSGFIGHTTTELDFIDDGTEPDYSLPHPREVNPFIVPSGIDYPKTVTYFENRLVFGGTLYRPTTLLMSESDNYTGWQVPAVIVPNQALEVEIAVRKREKMRGLLALQRLLIFTDATVRAMGGSTPLTPTTANSVRVISEVGCSVVPPMLAGNRALFVRAKGRGIHFVQPSESDGDSFGSRDISSHAAHFFREDAGVGGVNNWRHSGQTLTTEVVDWCWQEDPWNLIWMVRADGKLISLQLSEHAGYSLHATGPDSGDRFESVCSVPEGGEDVVYLCVQRNGTYNIERFASRVRRGTVADDCALDCAIEFTGIVPNGTALISVAGGIPNGRQVWAVAKDNAPIGPVTVFAGKADFTANGFKFPTANNGSTVTGWVGLLYQPELETLDVVSSDTRTEQKTVEKVAIEVAESAGFSVGQNPDELVPWKQRDATSGYGFPSAASAVAVVNVKGGWDNGARVTLKQTLPLPLTVLGITRKVARGG